MKSGGHVLVPNVHSGQEFQWKNHQWNWILFPKMQSQEQHGLLSVDQHPEASQGKAASVSRSPLKEKYINMWEWRGVCTPGFKSCQRKEEIKAPRQAIQFSWLRQQHQF